MSDDAPEVGELFKMVGDDGTGEEALDLMSRFVGDASGSMNTKFGPLGKVTVFASGEREISVFTREKDQAVAFFTLALLKSGQELLPFLYTEILRVPKDEYQPTVEAFKEAFEGAFKTAFTVEARPPGTVSAFRVEAAPVPPPAAAQAAAPAQRQGGLPAAFINLKKLK